MLITHIHLALSKTWVYVHENRNIEMADIFDRTSKELAPEDI